MKQRNILFLFLVLCAAFALMLSLSGRPTDITIESAIDDGFPVYMPSDDILQSMRISNLPILTKERDNRICTYLNIDFYYENLPGDKNNEKPAIRMVVSDGCAYPLVSGYPAELSWAVGGRAMRLGDDHIDQLPPIIYFLEPTRQFQYVVYSEETLVNTMKLLESMNLLK